MTTQIVTLDFETYYDKEYSLSKMTTQEYIADARFEIIGAAIKQGDAPAVFYPQEQFAPALERIAKQGPLVIVAHNALFDVSVLRTRFPQIPIAGYICTMSMMRSLGISHAAGGSLDALAKWLQAHDVYVPSKGTEVASALGKRFTDFSMPALQAYAKYCKTDVEICHRAFLAMLPFVPPAELRWQHIVIAMHADPQLTLNEATLTADLDRVMERRATMLEDLRGVMGALTDDDLLRTMRSNPKFAELLRSFGVEPPMKLSTTTGKETYAFAKSDQAMLDLLNHDEPHVRTAVEVRLGTKSSIEETRLRKFIELAQLPRLAMPFLVSGAHTHRLGGSDSINVQNLPTGRVEGQSNAIRMAIEAPEGELVVAADSSQIEVRVAAYIAQQTSLLDSFATGADPYCAMAEAIYNIPADEILAGHKAGDAKYKAMRQLAKAAVLGLGYGMGAERFLDSATVGYGVDIDLDFAKYVVQVYRSTNTKIVELWRTCNKVLECLVAGESGYFGGPNAELFKYGPRELLGEVTPGIMLPDGLWLTYPNLRAQPGDKGAEYVYDRARGKQIFAARVYGASLVENITQALAFALLKWQAIRISRKATVAFNVHDEFAVTALEDEAQEVKDYLVECMSAVPKWMTGCPITCEASIAKQYGAC